MNYPDTKALAEAAYQRSGHKTHSTFCNEYGCSLRSFRGWMAGERKMDGLAQVVFRQIVKGWHPK